MPSDNRLKVSVDLSRIRKNAEAILRQTGVPLIAVVKANAYGLGAKRVAQTIGDLVEAFYVFDADEAVKANLWDITKKRTIALHGNWNDPQEYLTHHVQPVVWSIQQATQLRSCRPVLSIDTSQQRFACPGNQAGKVLHAGDIVEVMTHAVTPDHVRKFIQSIANLHTQPLFQHAAGSALLDNPDCYLSAVRPGLALYRGAVEVAAPLVEVRESNTPAGYSGFISNRFGVILAGYANGLKRGPCLINGSVRQILEVGMQSAFVEVGPTDRRGDAVILLGEKAEINESAIANSWNSSPQEVLVRLTASNSA